MSLTTPVAAGTKIAGVKNASNEEVQSSRLVIGVSGDTPVSDTNPLPVAIISGGGGGGSGGASETTLAAMSGKLPATLGPKAVSASLSIAPATASDMATNTGIVAALAGVTFYPATQPVSATALPLPNGAATETKQDALNAKLPTLGAKAGSGSVSITPATDASFTVTGTFWQATQPVSAVTLPLPNGAATAAKQDALKTSVDLTTPADDLFAITPSDSTDLATIPKALFVTVDGNLAMRGTGGITVTLAVKAGQIIPLRARRVMATGTTATVVGLI